MEKNRKYLDQAAILLSKHRTFMEFTAHVQSVRYIDPNTEWHIIASAIRLAEHLRRTDEMLNDNQITLQQVESKPRTTVDFAHDETMPFGKPYPIRPGPIP